MATKGWVFVLFVIATEVASPGTNTSPSDSPAEHACTHGLRHADDDGHGTFIFSDALSGFAGHHWIPPSRASMECLQLSMDQQKISLSAVGALVDNITPKDCGEIYRDSKSRMDSGIYTIYPRSSFVPLRVFCRVEAGRAWTVIQRRQDGSVDFYSRTWEDYSRGFGNLTGEFWLGNDNIHLLTNQGRYRLNAGLEKSEYCTERLCRMPEGYLQYDRFFVENAQAKYRLQLGSYTGTPGMNYLSNQDNGIFRSNPCIQGAWSKSSCYLYKMGGFWIRQCDTLNPNGFYYYNGTDCPKQSKRKSPGIVGYGFIEMRISELE
ncbi:fibrinogen-like protein A [Branchiostoma lanceolatum]|uniref:fibrinogen-like protein A n=1 Tax=Branchiostoma lanceolatum TaxID=7740 RepID=UPI0034528693